MFITMDGGELKTFYFALFKKKILSFSYFFSVSFSSFSTHEGTTYLQLFVPKAGSF